MAHDTHWLRGGGTPATRHTQQYPDDDKRHRHGDEQQEGGNAAGDTLDVGFGGRGFPAEGVPGDGLGRNGFGRRQSQVFQAGDGRNVDPTRGQITVDETGQLLGNLLGAYQQMIADDHQGNAHCLRGQSHRLPGGVEAPGRRLGTQLDHHDFQLVAVLRLQRRKYFRDDVMAVAARFPPKQHRAHLGRVSGLRGERGKRD